LAWNQYVMKGFFGIPRLDEERLSDLNGVPSFGEDRGHPLSPPSRSGGTWSWSIIQNLRLRSTSHPPAAALLATVSTDKLRVASGRGPQSALKADQDRLPPALLMAHLQSRGRTR